MKYLPLLVILSFFLPLGASFAEETTEPEFDLPTYEFVEYITLPKPTRSPMPKAKSQLVGTSFRISLIVTKEGKAEEVRLTRPLASYSNVERMTFANQALEAVSKWRFQPARDAEDNPVQVKVIMPVKVVKYGKIYRALASIDFDDTLASK